MLSRGSFLLRVMAAAVVLALVATVTGIGTQPTVQRPGGDPGQLGILQRFTVRGDGTVRDNSTGLIWLRNANEFGRMTQAEAEAAVAGLSDGRHGLSDGSKPGDWRLPTATQWASLLDCRWSSPPLSDTAGAGQWSEWDPFFGVQYGADGGWYWTSTLCSSYEHRFYGISMLSCGHSNCSTMNPAYYVWPVRMDDAPGPDGGRFRVRGNGTVQDTVTGLVWMRDADRFGPVTKEEARALVRTLGHGTHGLTDHSQPGDWRIPTSTEWMTLLTPEWSSPPLWDTMGTRKWTEGDPFFSIQYDGYKPDYWSRSICHQAGLWYAHNMMSCAMRICSAVVDVKYYLWPVRDGR
jgi:hypothetical protein